MSENSKPEPPKELQALQTLEVVGADPLLIISTVFPFRFFPCVMQLDREKITISNQLFFFSREVENLFVHDLVSLSVTENLLFANITIVSGTRINKKFAHSFFWNADARKFRRLCEGLRIALKEKVDVMKISNQELVSKLEEIGDAPILD